MMAQFGWTASQYWDATMHEIADTIQAFEELNSADD